MQLHKETVITAQINTGGVTTKDVNSGLSQLIKRLELSTAYSSNPFEMSCILF